MKCPDCGKELVITAIGGFDDSFRCSSCGGVWVTGWVVNKIAQDPGEKLMIEPMKAFGVRGGSGNCPTDGAALFVQAGEELPSQVVIKKCNKCGWWWLPEDQVFELQKAYLLKKEYVRIWDNTPKWNTYALPIVLSLVLVAGLVGGMGLITQRQRPSIGATVGISNWSVTYLGQGSAVVSFSGSQQVDSLQYKNKTQEKWLETPVSCEGGNCKANLYGLETGGEYTVRVLGKEYTFMVK